MVAHLYVYVCGAPDHPAIQVGFKEVQGGPRRFKEVGEFRIELIRGEE